MTQTKDRGTDERRPLEAASGVIYTNVADMPSLEELLEQGEVALAVLERPVPASPATGARPGSSSRARRASRRTYAPLIGVTGFAAGMAVLGTTLLVDSIKEGGVQANPYTALSLALGGLLVLATLLVAVSGNRRK
jgi:hypothetical protein